MKARKVPQSHPDSPNHIQMGSKHGLITVNQSGLSSLPHATLIECCRAHSALQNVSLIVNVCITGCWAFDMQSKPNELSPLMLVRQTCMLGCVGKRKLFVLKIHTIFPGFMFSHYFCHKMFVPSSKYTLPAAIFEMLSFNPFLDGV